MEIIRIFDNEDQALYAIRYDDEESDEFLRLFRAWQDVEYLENFFETNKQDLSKNYKKISVKQAVLKTLNDAGKLNKEIYKIRKGNGTKKLSDLFKPLDNITYKPDEPEKTKAYGILENSWLRLYAIKIDEDYFLVTGGTIKLTRTMQEREHTQRQLDNLTRCYDYLKGLGIMDIDGLKEISK